MYSPTVFLRGPKFQMDVSKITGWRVIDAVMETKIKDAHAIDEDVVVAKMVTPIMDKILTKQRVNRDLIAR